MQHVHIRVLVEDVGLGMVLEVAVVPPVSRGALRGTGQVSRKWGHARLSPATPYPTKYSPSCVLESQDDSTSAQMMG